MSYVCSYLSSAVQNAVSPPGVRWVWMWCPLLRSLYSDGVTLDEGDGGQLFAELLKNDHSLQHVTVVNAIR